MCLYIQSDKKSTDDTIEMKFDLKFSKFSMANLWKKTEFHLQSCENVNYNVITNKARFLMHIKSLG